MGNKDLYTYIITKSIWYLINSWNFTADMWWFKFNNNQNIKELLNNDKVIKKIHRILAWNILEYTIMYFLELKWIPYESDKSNPFRTDTGVDILILDEQNWNIPLHCKASMIKNMVWQIRNWKTIMNDLETEGWYLVFAYIKKWILDFSFSFLKLLINTNRLINFPKTKDEIYEYERLLNDFLYSLEQDQTFWDNFKSILNFHNKFWLNWNIEIKGLITPEDYFKNSIFVWHNEKIPWTNFTQFFEEWSYFIRQDYNNYIKLNDLLS